MTEFQASNGRVLKWDRVVEDSVSIYMSDGTSSLGHVGYLDAGDMQALREFFAQERCDDMPFKHGGYWVFPLSKTNGGDRRVVVLVPGAGLVVYRERLLPGYVDGLQMAGYLQAAKAYFAAQSIPEPKPWLDAQNGEVWEIRVGDIIDRAICQREPELDSDDYHPVFYGPDFDGVRGDDVTAGTKLEVTS